MTGKYSHILLAQNFMTWPNPITPLCFVMSGDGGGGNKRLLGTNGYQVKCKYETIIHYCQG